MGSILPASHTQPQSQELLARSLMLWQQGDWQLLSQADPLQLEELPARSQLALLVAAAYQQLANDDQTRFWARQALAWGCDTRALVEILVAGVHNTLGRCAALLGNTPQMESSFRQAVTLLSAPPEPLTSHDRTVRELTRLGSLTEASRFISQEVARLQQQAAAGSKLNTQVTILKSELGLLQAELALAHRRGQLQNNVSDERQPSNSLEEAEARWLAGLHNKATSQIGQDIWVLEMTSFKRGGYFVEFGATNGILLSNSYLLEKEFGWHGLCAEPNPRSFEDLKKNRLCTVSPACIGAVSGEEVEFIFAEAYGGMSRDSETDNHHGKREAYREAGDTAILTTISLHDFLTFHNAPKRIDYISIDTEGSEFSILQNFPFEKWDVRLLTIEHNFTEQRAKIRGLLESNGYVCQEAQWDDWFYKPDL